MKHSSSQVAVIDDDALVRRGLTALLKSCGHTVEAYASASEYLERAPLNGVACLVLDVKMPGLSGLDLQRELATRGRQDAIVFITGHGDVPMSVRAIKGGAVDFLEKPFTNEALMKAVTAGLALARARQQEHNDRKEARKQIDLLTPREKDVFWNLIAGHSNKEIAEKLGTSKRTVESQRAQIIEKLGMSSTVAMLRLATRAGLKFASGEVSR